jgi:hypothetical protein
MSTSSLTLTIVWLDEHMLELELQVKSERFTGRTNFYTELDAPSILAAKLVDFPITSTDVRMHEFGTADLPGYGTAEITLCNRDSSGHLLVRVDMSWTPDSPRDLIQSAVTRVLCSPAEVDSFVSQLRSMTLEVGQSASLCEYP